MEGDTCVVASSARIQQIHVHTYIYIRTLLHVYTYTCLPSYMYKCYKLTFIYPSFCTYILHMHIHTTHNTFLTKETEMEMEMVEEEMVVVAVVVMPTCKKWGK